MNKNSHFIFLSLKKQILPTVFLLFTVYLIIFSRQNLTATKNGLLLWANSVVPSLLPFFIATELLSHTNIIKKIGDFLNPIMKPIFNVPGIGGYALIMGIISGYPVGAKIVTRFRKEGLCTKAEAERLLAFTNNSGPLFILGTVGISMFGNSQIGFLLLTTHILSCIIVGIVFRFWKKDDLEKMSFTKNTLTKNSSTVSFSNLGEILANSITNSVKTIVMIGGFVVLFSVIISILNNSGFLAIITLFLTPLFKIIGLNTNLITPLLSGILELTNGLNLICQIPQKSISILIIFSSFLLGFGGFSVLLQVLSITSKSDISIKPYFLGKFLQGTIACILTYIFIHIFPIFNFDITPIFSPNVNNVNVLNAYTNWPSILILCFLISFSLFLGFQNRKIRIKRN